MKKIVKRVAIGIGILLLLVFAFVRPYPFQGYYEGFMHRRLLTSEIKGALRISAIEHTDRYDEIGDRDQYQEKILQSKILSAKEVEELLTAIPFADARSGWGTSCKFSPHHRIEIERQDHTLFLWEICFACGEHEMPNDRKRLMPVGWETSLASFFKGIGMDPEIHKRKR